MKVGNYQRRFSTERPAVYDKNTRIVCMDIREDVWLDEEGNEIQGYSFIQTQIDDLIDYGHIKSQLIEAGYAQKDEFGLLMNAVDAIIEGAADATSWAKFKESLDESHIQTFREFCQFRRMCAETADAIMANY